MLAFATAGEWHAQTPQCSGISWQKLCEKLLWTLKDRALILRVQTKTLYLLGNSGPFGFWSCWLFLSETQSSSLFVDSIFVNSPTCQDSFVTLKSTFVVLLWTFTAIHRVAENLSCPLHHVLAEIEQRILPSFKLSYCQQVSFSQSIQCHIFCIFIIFVGDFDV